MRATTTKLNLVLIFLIAGILFSCRKDETVSPNANNNVNAQAKQGQTRVYYIAADEVDWNYTPSYPTNLITATDFTEEEEVFLENGPDRIGHIYKKSLYREYTDANFSTLKNIPQEWRHLGALGPLIRAEVGDTIKIYFKNNTGQTISMHPHGVFYNKDSEGAPYAGNSNGGAVAPGGTHTYIWAVPERAGPGPMDGSTVLWMYHSHTDEIRDTYSGLIGPLIVTARGKAREDGSPKDVDREFINVFHIYDENESWHIAANMNKATNPGSIDTEDEGFVESNLMHSINGYLYGNVPYLTMKKGEKVRWYVIGMGNEVDIHTPHWHGQTGLFMGMRTDMLEIFPGSMKMFDMTPDNAGTWLYHCHVNDHIRAGMLALFHVN